jgi:hypothetical protein
MKTSFSILALALAACGSNGNAVDGNGGNGDGGGSAIDAVPHPDGVLPQNCMGGLPPGTTECTDCVDNDMDGEIDGYDIECTGAADDDEGSFATNIPGDNIDPYQQDCFFDGNSGGGNDCAWHTCCLLDPPPHEAGDTCSLTGGPTWDPLDCNDAQTAQCITDCAPLTPPGCDCFGCCTLCDDAGCVDVLTNPAVAPNCDADSIHDPAACPPCFKNTECGTPCDPEMCILCPGQDPSDLPPTCKGAMCPGGAQECSTMPCPSGFFCSNGCCITVIE